MVILFDQFNLPDDVFEIIFATDQQIEVAKLLVQEMKINEGEIGKTQMSMFATSLHEGVTIKQEKQGFRIPAKPKKISYNKRQFYDRILTPMKAMGLVDYDLYKKTYRLSKRFSDDLIKIGLMWKKQLTKMGL